MRILSTEFATNKIEFSITLPILIRIYSRLVTRIDRKLRYLYISLSHTIYAFLPKIEQIRVKSENLIISSKYIIGPICTSITSTYISSSRFCHTHEFCIVHVQSPRKQNQNFKILRAICKIFYYQNFQSDVNIRPSPKRNIHMDP